jgi:hypothetical protein
LGKRNLLVTYIFILKESKAEEANLLLVCTAPSQKNGQGTGLFTYEKKEKDHGNEFSPGGRNGRRGP